MPVLLQKYSVDSFEPHPWLPVLRQGPAWANARVGWDPPLIEIVGEDRGPSRARHGRCTPAPDLPQQSLSGLSVFSPQPLELSSFASPCSRSRLRRWVSPLGLAPLKRMHGCTHQQSVERRSSKQPRLVYSLVRNRRSPFAAWNHRQSRTESPPWLGIVVILISPAASVRRQCRTESPLASIRLTE